MNVYVAVTGEKGLMSFATSVVPYHPALPHRLIRAYTVSHSVNETSIKHIEDGVYHHQAEEV